MDYCEGPGQALIVTPSGDVKPCCGFASDLDQLTIGNIYHDTVQTIIRQARKHPYVGKVFGKGTMAIRDEILARDPNALPGATTNHCYFCWHVLTRGLAAGSMAEVPRSGAGPGNDRITQGELLQLGGDPTLKRFWDDGHSTYGISSSKARSEEVPSTKAVPLRTLKKRRNLIISRPMNNDVNKRIEDVNRTQQMGKNDSPLPQDGAELRDGRIPVELREWVEKSFPPDEVLRSLDEVNREECLELQQFLDLEELEREVAAEQAKRQQSRWIFQGCLLRIGPNGSEGLAHKGQSERRPFRGRYRDESN